MNRAAAMLVGLMLPVFTTACRPDRSGEPGTGTEAQEPPALERPSAPEPDPGAESATDPASEPAAAEKNTAGPTAAGDGACQGAVACFEAARAAEQAGAREAALQLYERACNADGAQACARLGHMHRLGQGTEADEARGLDYLRRACRLGSPGACDALGH
jgi:TPR repeat protein